MKPEAFRVLIVLALVLNGFVLMGLATGADLIRWLAYGCWVLAAVYAILTSPRRFL